MASIDLTASATFPDGSADPDAQYAWSIDDETVAVVSAAANVATVLAQAAGTANVTVVATNPDGSSVSASIQVVISAAAPPVQDAVAVAITAGSPVDDNQFSISAGSSEVTSAPVDELVAESVNEAGQRTVVIDGVERVVA